MEDTIQARKIEIVDSAGKVRAILGTRIPETGQPAEEGPVLSFLTPAGRELVRFELEDNGREGGGYSPLVYMQSDDGQIALEANCMNGGAMLRVGEIQGDRHALIAVTDESVRMETNPR